MRGARCEADVVAAEPPRVLLVGEQVADGERGRQAERRGQRDDALVAYAKREGSNVVITVVNVDPHNAQEGLVVVPYELGVPPAFTVTDLIDLGRYDWHVGGNYVRLDPWERAGHILHVDTP